MTDPTPTDLAESAIVLLARPSSRGVLTDHDEWTNLKNITPGYEMTDGLMVNTCQDCWRKWIYGPLRCPLDGGPVSFISSDLPFVRVPRPAGKGR